MLVAEYARLFLAVLLSVTPLVLQTNPTGSATLATLRSRTVETLNNGLYLSDASLFPSSVSFPSIHGAIAEAGPLVAAMSNNLHFLNFRTLKYVALDPSAVVPRARLFLNTTETASPVATIQLATTPFPTILPSDRSQAGPSWAPSDHSTSTTTTTSTVTITATILVTVRAPSPAQTSTLKEVLPVTVTITEGAQPTGQQPVNGEQAEGGRGCR
ncbi:hypothetical protein FB451DRAFT_44603 [Mycena latifolia]|nr:hypothetical protein FB451DRAFT_44603 [Mycena latifolia]